MGYYIEVPVSKGKAKQIADLYRAMILPDRPDSFSKIPAGMALICVVDNGPWEAAALCYSEAEFNTFSASDVIRNPNPPPGITDLNPFQQRPRTWLLMDLTLACKLTGYRAI